MNVQGYIYPAPIAVTVQLTVKELLLIKWGLDTRIKDLGIRDDDPQSETLKLRNQVTAALSGMADK